MLILLVIGIVWYLLFKHYQRVKPIGKALDRTDDLKAQQELKDINDNNGSLEQQLGNKDHE